MSDEIVRMPIRKRFLHDLQERDSESPSTPLDNSTRVVRAKTGEILSTPTDKRINGLPRHASARAGGAGLKPPALWASREALVMPEAVGGQYPKGFLDLLARVLHTPRHRVLHVCSGALPPGEGIRVDRRAAAAPDVIADGRAMPFADGSFDAVAIDPPYSVEYAKELYGVDYPRPSHLLLEASRVVRDGGRVSMLHFLVPAAPEALEFDAVYGITTGVGYRIRALTVWRKRSRGLFA